MARDKVKARERSKRYYHRQKLKEKTPEEVQKKKAAAAERNRRYCERNADRVKKLRAAATRRYYAANREECLSRTHRRRAALEAGEVTGAQWLEIIRRHNGLCAYCKTNKGTEMDHVIPLSKGGQHTPENVVPSCRSCNAKKSNKLLDTTP